MSPFEIFPDNLYAENIESCGGIMQAKAVPVSLIKEKYGVDVVGNEIDVYDLTDRSGSSINKEQSTVKDAAVVIEDYRAPTKEYPDGRLIIVAADKLLLNTAVFQHDVKTTEGVGVV